MLELTIKIEDDSVEVGLRADNRTTGQEMAQLLVEIEVVKAKVLREIEKNRKSREELRT